MKFQHGGFAIGLVVGLLIGLALALGVALYITKAPVPFINKVPQRTAEQDNAEAERNKTWDPNAPLSGKTGARPAAPVAGASAAPMATAPATVPATAPATAAKPGRDPAAILSGAPSTATAADPFIFFVQVGAFTRAEDAEQQRARLAMLGYAAKVTEREQSGRTVFRVRAGPYESRDEADGAQVRLQEAGVEARLVRVERP